MDAVALILIVVFLLNLLLSLHLVSQAQAVRVRQFRHYRLLMRIADHIGVAPDPLERKLREMLNQGDRQAAINLLGKEQRMLLEEAEDYVSLL